MTSPGKENIAADSLSISFFMAWSQSQLSILSNLREVIIADPKLKAIFYLCIANNPPNHNYSLHDQLLFWKG